MFNFQIDNNTFNGLKKGDIKPVPMKDDPFDKTNYGPISISTVYLKLLNAAYMIKFMNILIMYYQKFNMPSEKVSVRSIH